MLDELSHDASHSTRGLVAEALDEQRVEIASGIVTRLRKSHDLNVSPLIVRTLVHTLAKALADGSPMDRPLVPHRRHAHPTAAVVAMIDTACAITEEVAHTFNGDLATIVVFLEIVKARAHAIATDEPALVGDAPGQLAIQSLLAMLRARDDATCSHSQATGEWARRIAQRLGLPPAMTELRSAPAFCTVGKIRVPDAILFKEGALAAPEWEIMKRHAESGAEILSGIPTLAQYAPIVVAHHERSMAAATRTVYAVKRSRSRRASSRSPIRSTRWSAIVPIGAPSPTAKPIAILDEGRGTQWDSEVARAMMTLAAEDRNRSTDASCQPAPGTPAFIPIWCRSRRSATRKRSSASSFVPLTSPAHSTRRLLHFRCAGAAAMVRHLKAHAPGVQWRHLGVCIRRK